MPLEKTGTCKHCGYPSMHCICNQHNQAGTTHRRNTSGDVARYQHFSNYHEQTDDYARTAEYSRTQTEQKVNIDIMPVHNENLVTFHSRTELSATESIKYAQNKHIYGGRKPWPSHTNSATCPVCTLSQQVETYRQILLSLSKLIDLSKYKIIVERGVTPLLTNFNIVPTKLDQ